MTEGVNTQAIAEPEKESVTQPVSDNARANFARLEKAKEDALDRAHRAETEAALMKQRMDMLEERSRPMEKDPLDGVEDYVDPARFRAAMAKQSEQLKKEAEQIADRKLNDWKETNRRENHISNLRSEFRDYDEVMNESNVKKLEETNPVFLKAILRIEDDYERKKLAYEYLKANKPKDEPKSSIKEKVEENSRNPYMIPSGSGTPAAVEFDLKSKNARDQAYAKLKAAQRRPMGNGFAPVQ